jgi:hypothetical protein
MSYLGFVPVAMAALAVIRRQKYAALWCAFTAGTLIFALGKHPYWNGRLIESITLPFAVLEHIPVLELLRLGNRFLILTSLGLAVLVAMGWCALRRQSRAGFLLLAGLICFEYTWTPFPMRPVDTSPLYNNLAAAGRRAVLDFPGFERSRGAHNMVAQTIHNLPIADGYLSTLPPEVERFLASDPVLSRLYIDRSKLAAPLDVSHLLDLGFDTMILHKYRRDSYGEKIRAQTQPWEITKDRAVGRLGGVPDEVMDRLREDLTEQCGPPAFEDEQIVVFYLDRRPSPTSASTR